MFQAEGLEALGQKKFKSELWTSLGQCLCLAVLDHLEAYFIFPTNPETEV